MMEMLLKGVLRYPMEMLLKWVLLGVSVRGLMVKAIRVTLNLTKLPNQKRDLVKMKMVRRVHHRNAAKVPKRKRRQINRQIL